MGPARALSDPVCIISVFIMEALDCGLSGLQVGGSPGTGLGEALSLSLTHSLFGSSQQRAISSDYSSNIQTPVSKPVKLTRTNHGGGMLGHPTSQGERWQEKRLMRVFKLTCQVIPLPT